MSSKSVLCLTGAGTNPNLLTHDVTRALLDWNMFTEPSPQWTGPTGIIRFGEGDTRRNFFDWLIEHTRDAFAPGDEPNFEDLIHIAELMGSILPLPPNGEKASFARFYGTGLLKPTAAGLAISDKNVRFVAEQATFFVLQTILERTRSERQSDARDLLSHLLASNFVLKHCTLNYDTLALPDSQTYWTGYPSVPGSNAFGFAAAPPDDHLNIQMHGSVHFAIDSQNVACNVVRYNDPGEASAHWYMSGSGNYAMDHQESPRVPIIVGKRKAEKALIEPFSSYLHYFRDLAFTTPRWLILGYGGGDYHVNGVLESAAEYWGDRLRAYVCNYLPQAEVDYGTEADYTYGPGAPCFNRIAEQQSGILKTFPRDIRAFYRNNHPRAILRRNAANVITERLRLSIDGKYYDHRDEIVGHLSTV